jgi:hypothetical protein
MTTSDQTQSRSPKMRGIVLSCVLILAVCALVWVALPRKFTDRASAPGVDKISAVQPSGHGVTAPGQPSVSEVAAIMKDPRAAMLRIGGVPRAVVPNVRGEYPRVLVPASAIIAASVPFAGAQPGEKIAVQAEDGGALLDAAGQGFVAIDEAHRAPVQFKVSAHEGMHRVTLRRGGETRVLEFWVGPEQPVLARN